MALKETKQFIKEHQTLIAGLGVALTLAGGMVVINNSIRENTCADLEKVFEFGWNTGVCKAVDNVRSGIQTAVNDGLDMNDVAKHMLSHSDNPTGQMLTTVDALMKGEQLT